MKKIVSIILVLVMVMSLAACATTNTNPTTKPAANLAGTYDIKVWVAENLVELTKTQIDNYNKTM